MYCKNCGKEINDNAVACPECGAATDNFKAVNDARSGGFAFLCFLFPLIGLILYLVWHGEYPLKAKSCGKGALIGVIVYVAFVILLVIISVVAASTIYTGTEIFPIF